MRGTEIAGDLGDDAVKPREKQKVLILFCGGTIIMKEGKGGSLVAPSRNEAVRIFKGIEAKLHTLSEYDIDYVENIDSTNMTPDKWDKIISEIAVNYERYDGFLITHGTDTMAYTAAALSLAVRNLGKPVVITGSQIPGSRIETDARRNLVNAMRLATMDLSGVYIVFDERVISGSRASKSSESKLDAFTSVNSPDAGEIRVKIHLSPALPKRKPGGITVHPGFEPDIFVDTLTPGGDPLDLVFLLQNEKIKGVILRAYGTGNLPYDFDMFFREARAKRVPVVVTSQCLHGMTMMRGYDVGDKALRLGAIEGYDQSLEMLAVKLMWALRHHAYEDIKTVMQTNFAGELDAKLTQTAAL